ncbi:MAG: tetratricopeptide repeat protein [Deltaproteobacteria bacterium]|nr:tetratricopeptide repeat protein [Deltaproteobacteria bacterium]
MSLWRLSKLFIIVLAVLAVLAFVQVTLANQTLKSSIGPTSESEKALLWEDATKSFEVGNYNDAIRLFERIIHRYPSSPNYLKAHFYLGQAYLKTNNPTKALTPLKYFCEATGKTELGIQGKLLLSEAYLEVKKFHEAYLAAQEIIQLHKKNTFPSEFWILALIHKAQAQTNLNHDYEATLTLEQAQTELQENQSLLKGKAAWVELQLKVKKCEKLGNYHFTKLNESQTRSQIERRGTCLLESLILYLGVLQENEKKLALLSTAQMTASFQNYSKICMHPPAALPTGKYTKKQINQYQKELIEVLTQDCKLQQEKARQLLTSLKDQIPPTMKVHIEDVIKKVGS